MSWLFEVTDTLETLSGVEIEKKEVVDWPSSIFPKSNVVGETVIDIVYIWCISIYKTN